MTDFTITFWILSVAANILISFPVLFDYDTEYPHGNHARAETVYKYSMSKRHIGLILGLMGVPLFIFLDK